MKRNILNSPRLLELKKHRHKILLGKASLYVFLFVVVMIGITYLSRLPSFNISSIEIKNNQSVDADMVKEIVQKEITGNYFWMFPRTNIFLYPKKHIKKELQDKFKRIKHTDFSIKDKKSLEVNIIERTALYTWCGNLPPNLESSDEVSKCYFLDDSGYIFDKAPYFSGDVYFKFYGLFVGDTTLGSSFSPSIFPDLILFKKKLEDIKLKPVALHVREDKDIKIFLSSKTKTSGMGPEIIVKVDSDFQKSAENLGTALDTEPFKSDFRNKYSSLEYIDLRFENKVVYKFK